MVGDTAGILIRGASTVGAYGRAATAEAILAWEEARWCLDLADNVSRFDGIAFVLEPLEDLAFSHGGREGRHLRVGRGVHRACGAAAAEAEGGEVPYAAGACADEERECEKRGGF
ncbi:unnamed protein product [Sphagnum balticum]